MKQAKVIDGKKITTTDTGIYFKKLKYVSIEVLAATFLDVGAGMDSSVGIATGWFHSRQCKIFLFSTASRPALGPIQPPIQWIPGAISPEIKRQGREANHTPPSSAVKNGGVIPPLPHMSSWHSA
jgi:hypothetical protein